MTSYVHSLPGRLRIKIPLLQGREVRAKALQGLVQDLEGIEQVEVNPITGSITMHYDPHRVSEMNLMELLKRNGYLGEEMPLPMSERVDQAAAKAGHALGRALCGWAVGQALQRTGLSFLAVLI